MDIRNFIYANMRFLIRVTLRVKEGSSTNAPVVVR